MDDQRARAEVFLQQQNEEIQRLRPWIAAEGKLGRPVHSPAGGDGLRAAWQGSVVRLNPAATVLQVCRPKMSAI
jgi:hypothetical protein